MKTLNQLKKKKVLVAIDFDPTAQQVAETAYALFHKADTEITLLHIVSNPLYYAPAAYDPFMGFSGYVDLDLLEPDVMQKLKIRSLSFLENCRTHLGDDEISIMVKEGDAVTCIEETAVELKADVIVMGSHSHRWLEEVIMGSITQNVLHRSFIPVLIIPTKKSLPTIF